MHIGDNEGKPLKRPDFKNKYNKQLVTNDSSCENLTNNGSSEIFEIMPDGRKKMHYSADSPLKIIINGKPNLRKNNNSPETALWQAVIIQALEDAASNSKKPKTQTLQETSHKMAEHKYQ